MKLEIILPSQMKTEGSVLIHQLKSMDFESRNIEFVERAPDPIIDHVTELATIIVK